MNLLTWFYYGINFYDYFFLTLQAENLLLDEKHNVKLAGGPSLTMPFPLSAQYSMNDPFCVVMFL